MSPCAPNRSTRRRSSVLTFRSPERAKDMDWLWLKVDPQPVWFVRRTEISAPPGNRIPISRLSRPEASQIQSVLSGFSVSSK